MIFKMQGFPISVPNLILTKKKSCTDVQLVALSLLHLQTTQFPNQSHQSFHPTKNVLNPEKCKWKTKHDNKKKITYLSVLPILQLDVLLSSKNSRVTSVVSSVKTPRKHDFFGETSLTYSLFEVVFPKVSKKGKLVKEKSFYCRLCKVEVLQNLWHLDLTRRLLHVFVSSFVRNFSEQNIFSDQCRQKNGPRKKTSFVHEVSGRVEFSFVDLFLKQSSVFSEINAATRLVQGTSKKKKPVVLFWFLSFSALDFVQVFAVWLPPFLNSFGECFSCFVKFCSDNVQLNLKSLSLLF